jgi:hypothetical protein
MPIYNVGLEYLKEGEIMISTTGNISTERVINQNPVDRLVDKGPKDSKQEKVDQTLQTTTKNVIENGKVILEQYDRHGRLICKTPPGYLPPGETI